MRYREFVELSELTKNGAKEDIKIKLGFEILQRTFNKIHVQQIIEIVSKLSDLEIKHLLESKSISIITDPHEMAEKLKVYESECEEPPSDAYWKMEHSYNSRRELRVLQGNCSFTKILQRFKYISIMNTTLDSEEILEKCDFEIEETLVVLVNEPEYYYAPKTTMYIYLPI